MKSIKFLVAALVVLTAVPMFAQTAVDDLDVTANVDAVCTIVANAVAFGAYDPLGGDVDAAGSVDVTCTKGSTGLRIDLAAGNNFGSGPSGATYRAMQHTVTATEFLSYQLFTDAARTDVWGEDAAGLSIADAPSSAVRNFPVYGRIPGTQDVAVGSYADVVVAEINY
ncbi:MAG TPA: spore coat U domain-containing protein [Thermoanaerobaculia bacterium]|nr:spore coat U domain-containing protein [Thermoanaerobaculia bacterium]